MMAYIETLPVSLFKKDTPQNQDKDMGFKKTLVCPTCDYRVLTGAGYDGGRRVTMLTHVCLDCRTLNDLILDREDAMSRFLSGTSKNLKPDKIRADEKCFNCKGTNFEIWDSGNMSCPKCQTQMKATHGGMHWD